MARLLSVLCGRRFEVTVEMRAHLFFGLGDKAEAPFVADNAAGGADGEGTCIPQAGSVDSVLTELLESLLAPGEVIELLVGRLLHLFLNVFVSRDACMALVERLRRHFTSVIDAHQASCMRFLRRSSSASSMFSDGLSRAGRACRRRNRAQRVVGADE